MTTVISKSDRQKEDEKLMGDALAFIAQTGQCTVRIKAVVGRMVTDDHLLITDACPAVVEAVIHRYRYVGVHEGGLLVNVRDFRDPEVGDNARN